MDSKEARNLMEAYSAVYFSESEEQIDEITADLGLRASKAADVKRAKLAHAGDKEGAAAKAAQAARLYKKQAKIRLNREENEFVDEATAMAKRGHDETAIRQKIAANTGGGQSADRATALANKQTYGQKGKGAPDPQARQRLAARQRGDFRSTTSSNPGLHGYGHKSNDPAVKAKQAARGAQRGALTSNEKKQLNMEMEYDVFDVVMEFLYVEGYAETLEEAEWMMANVIDEEAIDIILGEEQLDELSDKKVAKTLKARERRFDRSVDSGAPNKEFHQLRRTERLVASRNKRTGSNIPVDEAFDIILGEEQLDEISLKTKMKAYSASRDVDADYAYGSKVHDQGDRIKKAIVKKHGEKAGEHAERAAEVQNFGRGTPRAKPRIEKNRTYRTTKTGKMHGQDQAKLKKDLQYKRSSRNEEYMDEAQAARENPEKYEREQAKKSAPVRGERTPMPPRGNKKREDFEKWYAANVR